MTNDSHRSLVDRLLETLSLAKCLEDQDPPNPITRAAFQHSMQDLLAEFKAGDQCSGPGILK